jgi:hypothetical protein
VKVTASKYGKTFFPVNNASCSYPASNIEHQTWFDVG